MQNGIRSQTLIKYMSKSNDLGMEFLFPVLPGETESSILLVSVFLTFWPYTSQAIYVDI